ncbi:hypothetical protein [Dyella sp.]|uniref:hypothetical protein n=1 Tax=Dyella sp. TaxID=1869338 RepID=UPI002D7A1EEA|nr:hypothetical protein [Dyella sp.]HET6431687.1 hypothetical protein [Dyella sp.]
MIIRILRPVLIVLFAAAAAYAVRWQALQSAQAQADARLQRAVVVAHDARAQALQVLALRGSALAEDPAFVDYVVQSLQPNAALGGGIDRASISDLLNARRRGYDVAMVLDAQGMPAALDGVLLKDKASIQRDPLVTAALASAKPTQGAWIFDGSLLWVSVHPLLRGGIVQGALVAVQTVREPYPALVARHSGVATAMVVSGGAGFVMATQHALPGWAVPALPELASTLPPDDALPPNGRALEVPGAGSVQPGWVLPLSASGGRAMMFLLDSNRPEATAARGERLLYGVIAALALLALLASTLGGRRRPD